MKTLQDEWSSYRDACYPEGLPADQNRECHQAFFAGCLVVLKFATDASADLPEAEARKFVAGIIREAQEVCQQRVNQLKGNN